MDSNGPAKKMAEVFKIDSHKADEVMRTLEMGWPWKFDKKVSDRQADRAARYLKNLGFQVELIPLLAQASPAVAPEVKPVPAAEPKGGRGPWRLEFLGNGGELFGITIVNLLLNTVTLGIYHFWAKTRVRRYLYEKTSFAGNRFSYHGTRKELFLGFFKFIAIAVVVFAGAYFMEAYLLFKGTSLAALEGAANWFSMIAVLSFPIFLVGAWRYRVSRTSWRGIRFSFRGERLEGWWVFMKGWFLTGLTLGLYYPFFAMHTQSFWRNKTFFGNSRMSFDGSGKDVFPRFLLALVLTIPTLGINWIWYKVYLQKYLWSHTSFEGGNFKFTATGWQMCGLLSFNFLILAFTLGLGFPWVTVRSQKFMADHLYLEGNIHLDEVVQAIKKSGAVGEGALDAFDVPLDVI